MKCIHHFIAGVLAFIILSGCTKEVQIASRASGTDGIVSTENEDATRVGLEVLKSGGNAADAAIASLLTLSFKKIGAFCPGGEVPLIYYNAANGDIKVFNGQGGAPLDEKAIKWYYENRIPSRDMKSAAVPGVIDLCVTVLKKYGTMTFGEVVKPSLKLLDRGGPTWYVDLSGSGDTIRSDRNWYSDLAVTYRKLVEAEDRKKGSREEKLQAVADRFYRGDIADELEKWYIEKGGFLRKKDLEAHITRIEDPVKINYRGCTIVKCGPWTQGPYLLQTMRLLEGYNLKSMGHNSANYIHVVTEAMKLALADRDEYYGDPEFIEVPMKNLLSDKYTEIRRSLINMDQASNEIRPGDPYHMSALRKDGGRALKYQSGTTVLVVADKWGNVVSATPSGLSSTAGFGGTTGVTHGTRLFVFNTWKDHPNNIAAGKRPRTTLSPSLVLKDGKPLLAISVAGGDMQDIAAIQLIANFVDFGMNLDDTYTSPRFATNHFIGSFGQSRPRFNSLSVPGSVDPNVIQELKKKGHDVYISGRKVGDVAMLYIDQVTGKMQAAGEFSAVLKPDRVIKHK
jgi:gamma-glutamyltranspeptidase/glutathione hydrolase